MSKRERYEVAIFVITMIWVALGMYHALITY